MLRHVEQMCKVDLLSIAPLTRVSLVNALHCFTSELVEFCFKTITLTMMVIPESSVLVRHILCHIGSSV